MEGMGAGGWRAEVMVAGMLPKGSYNFIHYHDENVQNNLYT